jgi:hypothetical protein
MKGCLILLTAFSASVEMFMCFFFFASVNMLY